ncbi:MAG TPA: anti-sigma factor [Streptosporangiaceae bacterium]
MSHLDPDLLALIALGEETEDPGQHLAGCAECRAEVDQFAAVVATARHGGDQSGEGRTGAGRGGPVQLTQPPPELWDRIAVAAGLETGPDASRLGRVPDLAAPGGTSRPGGPGGYAPARQEPAGRAAGAGPWWRRHPLAAGLAAAFAGLIIGAGAALGIHQLRASPATRVVASIPLRPLPEFPQWHGASGTAVMQTGPGGRQLSVLLRAPRRPGFYEVWLLARDGVSMISLGDLRADHTGRFAMPPGVDLRNYSRIDVSLQSFNGSTLHAKTSVVRGSLP